MDHLLGLRYETEPDYFYLNSLLESMASSANVPLDQPMEWQREDFGKPIPSRSKRHSQAEIAGQQLHQLQQQQKPAAPIERQPPNDPAPPPPLSLSPALAENQKDPERDENAREEREKEKERLRTIRREERQRGRDKEKLRKEKEAEEQRAAEEAATREDKNGADVLEPERSSSPATPKRQKPPKATPEIQHAKVCGWAVCLILSKG